MKGVDRDRRSAHWREQCGHAPDTPRLGGVRVENRRSKPSQPAHDSRESSDVVQTKISAKTLDADRRHAELVREVIHRPFRRSLAASQEDGLVAERLQELGEADRLYRGATDVQPPDHTKNPHRLGVRPHVFASVAPRDRATCDGIPLVRALVTGCAGFIGSHLTESLLQGGAAVLGVDCFNDNYARPQKLRNIERARDWRQFDFVPIDLARGDLADVAESVEVIFHLAAEPGVRTSWGGRFESYVRNNVVATQHLLEAAASTHAPRFVYASSSSVYGNDVPLPTREHSLPRPVSPYGVTKLSGEHLCLAYHANLGLDVVVLRYFSAYGPRQRPDMAFARFFNAILADRPLEVLGTGEQSRDFTFVSDIVAATVAAASAPKTSGKIFNVGGGSRVPLQHALSIIADTVGRRPQVITRDVYAGDVLDSWADISQAKKYLGYEPETELASGLQQQWAWTLADQRPGGSPIDSAEIRP